MESGKAACSDFTNEANGWIRMSTPTAGIVDLGIEAYRFSAHEFF